MKEWGLTIVSGKKIRRALIGDNLEADLAPMSFSHNDGGEVIKEVLIAYIPHLWEKIEDLNQNSDDKRG